MLYNISFDLCAGVIMMIVIYIMTFSRDLRKKSNRLLLLVMIMHFISIVFDIGSSLANSLMGIYSPIYRDFTNYVFLGVHTSEAAVFFYFLLVELNVVNKLKFLIWLPEILMVLMPLLLNPFNHAVFFYNKQMLYIHGCLMSLLYLCADFYMFLCIMLVLINRQRISRRQWRASIALLILSVVPMLVQSLLMPHQLIEMFFQSLGLFGYMMAVENVDEARHPVTKAFNRQALIRDYVQDCLKGHSLGIIIIKISQITMMHMAIEDDRLFYGMRLTLAEWFQSLTKDKNKRFYDCERGVYVILTDGNTDQLRATIKERFKNPWHYQRLDVMIPMMMASFTSKDAITPQQFLSVISLPYMHHQDGVVTEDIVDLLSLDHLNTKLPDDLENSLNLFLERLQTLSKAERHICDLYMMGYEIRDIPEKAFISMNTVKKHNKNIYQKLHIHSKEELMFYVDLFFWCEREEDLGLNFNIN